MAERRSFKAAVVATPSVSEHYHPGLGALRKVDRDRVACIHTRQLSGSVDLDSAIDEPNSPVWDYGIGYQPSVSTNHNDEVYWIEVHPANSKHVSDVINKLNWLKQWLERDAPRLKQLRCAFVWVASGAVALPPNSRQRKIIASHGIHFAGTHLQIPLN